MTRILVIEDDPAILRGLVDNLRHESYDVVTATNGESGYRMIHEWRPDLILLDLTLPLLDGTAVCRQARSSGITTPIIMLTARGDETDRIVGLNDGADDYVTKPFSIGELTARVRAILRQRQGWMRDRAHFDQELRQAAEVQRRLLPQFVPSLATLDLAATCQPASAVGGDYFDFIEIAPGTVALVLADVCGKGVAAALLAASLHAAVRSHGPVCGTDCGALLEHINALLLRNGDPGRYATMFYGVYVDRTRMLRYANAGHPRPVLFSDRHGMTPLDNAVAPLGIFPALNAQTAELAIGDGDRLVIVSDGVIEAVDTQGEEFGVERLAGIVRASDDTAASMCARIEKSVAAHASGRPPHDDVTALVAMGRRRAAAAAAS